jgi:hypothetical protein
MLNASDLVQKLALVMAFDDRYKSLQASVTATVKLKLEAGKVHKAAILIKNFPKSELDAVVKQVRECQGLSLPPGTIDSVMLFVKAMASEVEIAWQEEPDLAAKKLDYAMQACKLCLGVLSGEMLQLMTLKLAVDANVAVAAYLAKGPDVAARLKLDKKCVLVLRKLHDELPDVFDDTATLLAQLSGVGATQGLVDEICATKKCCGAYLIEGQEFDTAEKKEQLVTKKDMLEKVCKGGGKDGESWKQDLANNAAWLDVKKAADLKLLQTLPTDFANLYTALRKLKSEYETSCTRNRVQSDADLIFEVDKILVFTKITYTEGQMISFMTPLKDAAELKNKMNEVFVQMATPPYKISSSQLHPVL